MLDFIPLTSWLMTEQFGISWWFPSHFQPFADCFSLVAGDILLRCHTALHLPKIWWESPWQSLHIAQVGLSERQDFDKQCLYLKCLLFFLLLFVADLFFPQWPHGVILSVQTLQRAAEDICTLSAGSQCFTRCNWLMYVKSLFCEACLLVKPAPELPWKNLHVIYSPSEAAQS